MISKYDGMPKIELHLHLEGAIPLDALWELCRKYGGDPAVPDISALERRFVYKDFPHFLETWRWMTGFLREYEDFSFIAEAVARDLAAQKVLYAEAFYSPADFARHGLAVQPLTEAIRRGLDRVPGIDISLVADLDRNFGPERGAATLREVNEVRDSGVIGIGIGGAEQLYPPEPFAAVYAEARRLGFHTSAHAGEAAGAESVRGAMESLEVERIGHGTRAFEDAALVDYLAEKRIPLEMCPISNLRTGVVPSLAEHPIRRAFERGLMVTVNTDDPKMFGNSLAMEFEALERELGFTEEEISALTANAVEACWLPKEGKDRLARRLGLPG